MTTASLKLYNGKNYQFEAELNTNILSIDLKQATQGSSSGDLTIEIDNSNRALLESLRENSHFLTFSIDSSNNLFSGIIDTAFCTDNECSIKIIGFLEYLDKITAISSYKRDDFLTEIKIDKEDKSWEKNFLADSSEGLFYELFNNLEEYMNHYGYNKFWEWDGIINHIRAVDTDNWRKSYHLNSVEFPTMKSIAEEILNDESCAQLDVTADTSDGYFKWKLSFNIVETIYNLTTANDYIYNVEFTFDGLKSRTSSLTKGQDKDQNPIISKIEFDEDVAFSDYINEETTNESSPNPASINYSNVNNLKKLTGQISFKTEDAGMAKLNSIVNLTTDTRNIKMIISEVSFDGRDFTFTGNSVKTEENLNKIKTKKPNNILKKRLEDPLRESFKNSRKSVFGEKRATGWRRL